jgi:hypothetical protein
VRRSLHARGQVQEKEGRLRVMMRMMGLGTAAYWAINYAFWLLVYVFFAVVFSVVAAFVRLPSGYRIGLFTQQVPPTPRRRGGGPNPHRGGARGLRGGGRVPCDGRGVAPVLEPAYFSPLYGGVAGPRLTGSLTRRASRRPGPRLSKRGSGPPT